MSIQKKEYELSIWSEILGENGQKIERKEYIIGAHDMDYLGRATNIKLTKKLNGTHSLTFQMPDKWYDHEKGEYVRNEFVEQLFNEKKVKLHYMDEWYEFYIKNVQDTKQFKSYMKSYTCSDAFIDELSRNGYGITFDEELYNNVEEIGTFTEEILEDSVWYYSPQNNWGDFTEYLEEKMYKIPVSFFINGGNKLEGYQLNYTIDGLNKDSDNSYIKNLFTKEKRLMEMGDDFAREQYYWDQQGRTEIKNRLIGEKQKIENDGYIYVFLSDLDFCYRTTSEDSELVATEEIQPYGNTGRYAIAPTTVDPSALIQFIAFPEGAVLEVDEAGMIVNKDYHYVMTVGQWNEYLEQTSNYFYKFESLSNEKRKYFLTKEEANNMTLSERQITGNWAVYYEGFLDKVGDLEVLTGKKISITDHTEINITDNIDQYVVVYNNHDQEFENMYVNPDEQWIDQRPIGGYRVCSVNKTRQVVPQLARNLVENAIEIKSEDGWSISASSPSVNHSSASVKFVKDDGSQLGSLQLTPTSYPQDNSLFNTIINFGIVGQEYEIQANKIYCLGISGTLMADDLIIIGEGGMISSGEYKINDKVFSMSWSSLFSNEEDKFYLIRFNKNIKNPYFAIEMAPFQEGVPIKDQTRVLKKVYFFEAYTKGLDQFTDPAPYYKYSGRNLFEDIFPTPETSDENPDVDNDIKVYNFLITESFSEEEIRKRVLFENDVMPGDTYAYKEYFIQQLQAENLDNGKNIDVSDTYGHKEFLSPDAPEIKSNGNNISYRELPYSSKDYTDDNIIVSTKYIDLNKCPYYDSSKGEANACDCCYNGEKFCMYQKYGYCPYLFQSEKHCRKIRTLKGEKSNRFNLTQELGKVFEVYPCYWINHEENGKVKNTDKMVDGENQTVLDKRVFYITEKGSENKLGFRYELNLSNISRTIKSDQIVTKLYVQDVDSQISKTGLCSIKTAPDNPSKDSFIIDFSYYVSKGILSEESVLKDLYGLNSGDMGYLKQLGHYNEEYDKLSDLIINLSSQSFTELEANVNVNLEGIETAQQQLAKLKKQKDKYYTQPKENEGGKTEQSQTYKNYLDKISEQISVLNQLIIELMCDENNYCVDVNGNEKQLDFKVSETAEEKDPDLYSQVFGEVSIQEFKESDFVKKHSYKKYGMLGQYNKEYEQIQKWRRQQAEYLKQINQLSLRFFKKYEPYLKEGTWSDSNYLTDNAYYFGAKEVAAEGAIPKVEYSITVVDLYALPEYEEYKFDIADTTYVEDIGMFGVNEQTGLPNKLKVLISEITYDLDQPKNNSIKVQNFTTQFEDLFQQVSASVQSLSFNENIYKRSSNFTSNQNIKKDSLQGALDNNDVTLLKTSENNIELNAQGQSGSDINNHSNQYKIDGQGMSFSNNGGQSWNVGVGPKGINADYIKVGSMDVGKVRLVDNDYLYFMWDKDGIVALRDPVSTQGEASMADYAVFNKYGLSIIEEGKIRLRAGYDYATAYKAENADGTITYINKGKGKYSPDDPLSPNVGFYLYDKEGRTIFSTQSENNYAARLSLKGEILATAASKEAFTILYRYSKGVILSSESLYTLGEEITNPVTDDELTPTTESCYIILNFANEITPNKYPIYSYNGKKVIKYNNVIYNVDNKTTAFFYNGDAEIYEGELTQTTNSVLYYKKDNSGAWKITGINNYYKKDNNYYSVADSIIKKQDDDQSGTIKSRTGVFINNQVMSDESDPDYDKRVFSCLTLENGSIKNLFTITENGTLQIGGTAIPRENAEGDIEAVSDYLKLEDVENSIRVVNGHLFLGNKDIADSIREASENVSYHYHDYVWYQYWLDISDNPSNSNIAVWTQNSEGKDEVKYLHLGESRQEWPTGGPK